jgi:transposase
LNKSRRAPARPVEVWALDEHRVGLKPVLRRQWAPKGERPIACAAPGYEWLYLYASVRPATGQVVWFLGNRVNTPLFTAILASFAREVGAGPGKSVLVMLDNAGWHSSPQLIPPLGVRLCFLPAYTPELQPAERLWPLTNEAIANRSFATLDELGATLAGRCRRRDEQPGLIKAPTHYACWPEMIDGN